MAESHVVSALREKRAEIASIIADLEKRINGYRGNLVHLDATLRLFAPAVEPAEIKPKAVRERNNWFRNGECIRFVYDVLRRAGRPLSSREIALEVMVLRGLDSTDARTLCLMQKTVHGSLVRAKKTVIGERGEAGATVWRLAE